MVRPTQHPCPVWFKDLTHLLYQACGMQQPTDEQKQGFYNAVLATNVFPNLQRNQPSLETSEAMAHFLADLTDVQWGVLASKLKLVDKRIMQPSNRVSKARLFDKIKQVNHLNHDTQLNYELFKQFIDQSGLLDVTAQVIDEEEMVFTTHAPRLFMQVMHCICTFANVNLNEIPDYEQRLADLLKELDNCPKLISEPEDNSLKNTLSVLSWLTREHWELIAQTLGFNNGFDLFFTIENHYIRQRKANLLPLPELGYWGAGFRGIRGTPAKLNLLMHHHTLLEEQEQRIYDWSPEHNMTSSELGVNAEEANVLRPSPLQFRRFIFELIQLTGVENTLKNYDYDQLYAYLRSEKIKIHRYHDNARGFANFLVNLDDSVWDELNNFLLEKLGIDNGTSLIALIHNHVEDHEEEDIVRFHLNPQEPTTIDHTLSIYRTLRRAGRINHQDHNNKNWLNPLPFSLYPQTAPMWFKSMINILYIVASPNEHEPVFEDLNYDQLYVIYGQYFGNYPQENIRDWIPNHNETNEITRFIGRLNNVEPKIMGILLNNMNPETLNLPRFEEPLPPQRRRRRRANNVDPLAEIKATITERLQDLGGVNNFNFNQDSIIQTLILRGHLQRAPEWFLNLQNMLSRLNRFGGINLNSDLAFNDFLSAGGDNVTEQINIHPQEQNYSNAHLAGLLTRLTDEQLRTISRFRTRAELEYEFFRHPAITQRESNLSVAEHVLDGLIQINTHHQNQQQQELFEGFTAQNHDAIYAHMQNEGYVAAPPWFYQAVANSISYQLGLGQLQADHQYLGSYLRGVADNLWQQEEIEQPEQGQEQGFLSQLYQQIVENMGNLAEHVFGGLAMNIGQQPAVGP